MKPTAYKLIILLIIPLISLASDLPYKPSFDCSKATSKIEHLICSSGELSQLDLTLANVYKAARAADSEHAHKYKFDQRQWLKYRNHCKRKQEKISECTKNRYIQRIRTLVRESGLDSFPAKISPVIEKYGLNINKPYHDGKIVIAKVVSKQNNELEISWENEKSSWIYDYSYNAYLKLSKGCALIGHCDLSRINIYKSQDNCVHIKNLNSKLITVKANESQKCLNRKRLYNSYDISDTVSFEGDTVKLPNNFSQSRLINDYSLSLSNNNKILLSTDVKEVSGIRDFPALFEFNPTTKTATLHEMTSLEDFSASYHNEDIILRTILGLHDRYKGKDTAQYSDNIYGSIYRFDSHARAKTISYSYPKNFSGKFCDGYLRRFSIKNNRLYISNGVPQGCGGGAADIEGVFTGKHTLETIFLSDLHDYFISDTQQLSLIRHGIRRNCKHGMKCATNESFFQADYNVKNNAISIIPLKNKYGNISEQAASTNNLISTGNLISSPALTASKDTNNKTISLNLDKLNRNDTIKIKFKILPSFHDKDKYSRATRKKRVSEKLPTFGIEINSEGTTPIFEISDTTKFKKEDFSSIEEAIQVKKKTDNIQLTFSPKDLPYYAMKNNLQCYSIDIEVIREGVSYTNYIKDLKTKGKTPGFCLPTNNSITLERFTKEGYIQPEMHESAFIVIRENSKFIPYSSSDGLKFKKLKKLNKVPSKVQELKIIPLISKQLKEIEFQSSNYDSQSCSLKHAYYSPDLHSVIFPQACKSSPDYEEISIIPTSNNSIKPINGHTFKYFCYKNCESNISESNFEKISLFKTDYYYMLKIDDHIVAFNSDGYTKSFPSHGKITEDEFHANNLIPTKTGKIPEKDYVLRVNKGIVMNEIPIGLKSREYSSKFSSTTSYNKHALKCLDQLLVKSIFPKKSIKKHGDFFAPTAIGIYHRDCIADDIDNISEHLTFKKLTTTSSKISEIDKTIRNIVSNLTVQIDSNTSGEIKLDLSGFNNLKGLKLINPEKYNNHIKMINIPNSIESFNGKYMTAVVSKLINLKKITSNNMEGDLFSDKDAESTSFDSLKELNIESCSSNWPQFKVIDKLNYNCIIKDVRHIPPYRNLTSIHLKTKPTPLLHKWLYSLENLKSLYIESDSDKVILAEPRGKITTTLKNLTLAVHYDFKTENLNVINSYSNIETLNLKVNAINGIGRIIEQQNIKNLQLEVYRKQNYSREDVSFLQSMEQLSINFDICRYNENVVFSNLRSLNINGTCLFESSSSYNFPLLAELQINKPISPKEFNNLPDSLTTLTSHSIRNNKEKTRLKIKKFESIEVYSDSKILQELVKYGTIKSLTIKNNLLLDEITFTKRLKYLVSNQKRTEAIKESCLYIKPREDNGNIRYFLPTSDCIYTGYKKL